MFIKSRGQGLVIVRYLFYGDPADCTPYRAATIIVAVAFDGRVSQKRESEYEGFSCFGMKGAFTGSNKQAEEDKVMKTMDTVTETRWGEKERERAGGAGAQVSFGEVIVRVPLAILGLAISAFPLSLPLLYLVALLFV
jgi:hypothetical protein